MRVLITGGAGFVGSNLALLLKKERDWSIVALDNLKRRGSELTLGRLRDAGVGFVHGDIRNPEDIESLERPDLIIECSAEPSVHAGYDGGARYLVNTNLLGAFNCLEFARKHKSAVLFLSSSRVYSIEALRNLPLHLSGDRLAPLATESGTGWSELGISENFSMAGSRSLYGTTKLAAELLIEEYHAMYGLRTVVNRCGVITGPWQMGKVDQGFFVLWAASHLYDGDLSYSGFGGHGHQVRDVLHVADLCKLICNQIDDLEQHSGKTYNVGGGVSVSISLAELTRKCASRTGRNLMISSNPVTRPADIPYYVTDFRAVNQATGWSPAWSIDQILDDVLGWLNEHRKLLEPILSSKIQSVGAR